MIATVLALVIGGLISIVTLICLAYLLAYLQDPEND